MGAKASKPKLKLVNAYQLNGFIVVDSVDRKNRPVRRIHCHVSNEDAMVEAFQEKYTLSNRIILMETVWYTFN